MRLSTGPRQAKLLAIDPSRPDWASVRQAASHIMRGEVIAAPTDTLYGVLGDPFDHRAVERIFAAKRRPETKPLLLIVDGLAQLNRLVRQLPPTFDRLAQRFWPGPLTIVLPASDAVPAAVTAGTGTIAVRWPQAPLAGALVRAAGRPLTATSANRSGLKPGLDAREVQRQLGRDLALIVDGGRVRSLRPSTIVDLTGAPKIVREGAIAREEVLRRLT